MKPRKLREGPKITSLDQLDKCEWVIIHDKPYHHGWVESWKLRMAKIYVDRGVAFEGVRLTNAEYYSNLTDEKLKERFYPELHKVCPYGKERGMAGYCGEGYCDEALSVWKGEPVK